MSFKNRGHSLRTAKYDSNVEFIRCVLNIVMSNFVVVARCRIEIEDIVTYCEIRQQWPQEKCGKRYAIWYKTTEDFQIDEVKLNVEMKVTES